MNRESFDFKDCSSNTHCHSEGAKRLKNPSFTLVEGILRVVYPAESGAQHDNTALPDAQGLNSHVAARWNMRTRSPKKIFIGVLILICLFFLHSNSWAQSDSVSIESTGHCYSSEVTPDEGWHRALQDAEANAIRTALGITVSGHTFQLTSESMKGDKPTDYLSTFSELNTTTTSGRIVAEKVTDSTLSTEGNLPMY